MALAWSSLCRIAAPSGPLGPRRLALAAAAGLCLLLAACATRPVQPLVDAPPFQDQRFRAPSEPVDRDRLFALSEEMQAYLDREIALQVRRRDRQQGLYDALYRHGQLRLEYDSSFTRNAAEAFAARTGNCLSLVILTAAFARELGLTVQYQHVFTAQTMSRVGDVVYFSGHVNVVLGVPENEGGVVQVLRQPRVIDFLPPEDPARQRTRMIRERTIVAMYMNNRAAETLAAGRLDDAYWWARAAIAEDPTFLSAYNTLGVVYQRHGDLADAERMFRYLIGLQPRGTSAMSNLANVLQLQGRGEEAGRWRAELARIQGDPPFHFFDLGVRAMKEGAYTRARDLFTREIERAAYYHEFHAWLAAAHEALDDRVKARKHLLIALDNATTRADRDAYVRRLAALGVTAPAAGPGD